MSKQEKAPIPIDGDRKAEEEKAERLQGYLTGKLLPPNKTIEYLVEKLRAARMEKDEVIHRLRQSKAAAEILEKKAVELQAVHNNYMEDLEHFDNLNQGGKE